MSSRTCPDWPELMEIAPDLQFKHYTVAEARLPADALVTHGRSLAAVAICCDLEQHVFYAAHTDPESPRRCATRTGTRCASGRDEPVAKVRPPLAGG